MLQETADGSKLSADTLDDKTPENSSHLGFVRGNLCVPSCSGLKLHEISWTQQIFFDKDGSRSQVSTNLEIKLRIFVQYKKILMEILQLLTFSIWLKALELAASFFVSKMIRRQSSEAKNRGDMCKK